MQTERFDPKRAVLRAAVLGVGAAACLAVLPLAGGRADARENVVALLRDLPDNSAMWLPPYRVEGDGLDAFPTFADEGPGVRDYSRKLVYSPSRRAAFYVGGNHCSPHRFNDVWRYELAEHVWTMLYRPDYNGCPIQNEKVQRYCVVRDHVVQTRRGGPCSAGHTWWGVTFDETAGRLLWMNANTDMDDAYIGMNGLKGRVLNERLAPLWSFDPDRRKWSLVRTEGPHPRGMFGGFLEFIPGLNRTLWYGNEWYFSGLWALDLAAGRWTDLKPNGRSKGYGSDDTWPVAETISAYSPVHNKILAVGSGSGNVHLYDVATSRWRVVRKGRRVDPNGVLLAFDSVNEVFLYWDGDRVLGYDPAADRWIVTAINGPRFEGRLAGYFDPEYNVLVGYNGKRMYAYRFRRRNAETRASK